VDVIQQYESLVDLGQLPPTYPADIAGLAQSLGGTYKEAVNRRSLTPLQQEHAAAASLWLQRQARLLLAASAGSVAQDQGAQQRLQVGDLCRFALTLPSLVAAQGSNTNAWRLAEEVADCAASYVQQGIMPASVRQWQDLLYGLTKSGLVVNTEDNASQAAVKRHSRHLNMLLQAAAQQLPGLLSTQGAKPQEISLTVLAYAYAGYTARDLSSTVRTLGQRLDVCMSGAKPQELSNTLYAMGKLARANDGIYSPTIFTHCLRALCSQVAAAKPQELSMAIYTCAIAGHVECVPELVRLTCHSSGFLAGARSQEFCNMVWAIAKLCEQVGLSEEGQQGLGERRSGATGGELGSSSASAQPLAAGVPVTAGVSTALHQSPDSDCSQLPVHADLLLERMATSHAHIMQQAKPQEWANAAWAAAKLGCAQYGAELLAAFCRSLPSPPPAPGGDSTATAIDVGHNSSSSSSSSFTGPGSVSSNSSRGSNSGGRGMVQGLKSQEWANLLWAAAKLDRLQEGTHLLSLMVANLDQAMKGAIPQTLSISLWATAALYEASLPSAQEGPAGRAVAEQVLSCGHALLVHVCQGGMLAASKHPQEISNTLWAAATLHWYNREFFTMGVATMADLEPSLQDTQVISNTLYAAAMCGHWDAGVQQLLGLLNRDTLRSFQAQHVTNTALSWAILSCIATKQGSNQRVGQATAAVLRDAGYALFTEAAARPASGYISLALRQLITAHWYANMVGLPGLPPGEVYDALSSVAFNFGDQTTSNWQRHAADILRNLGYTVEVEQMSQDRRMRADIVINALPSGTPCCIAVECDGPSHYVAEVRNMSDPKDVVYRLDGRTHLRNLLLRQSFPDGVVCVPGRLWASMKSDIQKQEYLQEVLFVEHLVQAQQQVGEGVLHCM
jgi:hypothetical protein